MGSQRYMLDTNTSSYIIKGKPIAIREHLRNVPIANICISAITEAELLTGVAIKPDAKYLPVAVQEFLLRVDILPWDSDAANAYTQIKTACKKEGTQLSTMDTLIAAHCIAAGAVLITNDQSFNILAHYLTLQDWTKPMGYRY